MKMYRCASQALETFTGQADTMIGESAILFVKKRMSVMVAATIRKDARAEP